VSKSLNSGPMQPISSLNDAKIKFRISSLSHDTKGRTHQDLQFLFEAVIKAGSVDHRQSGNLKISYPWLKSNPRCPKFYL